MRRYIFVDSKSKFSVDQFAFAFENGLFDKDDVEVIVRVRVKNILRHIRCWRKYGYRVRFSMGGTSKLLDPSGGIIFYFFNSLENVALLKNRSYLHVFVGHGESNKRASLHPLYRIYDYLLVSGPYARERFVQYDVLNSQAASDRVLDIGGAGVADVSFKNICVIGETLPPKNARALLYMPTWEGGLETENYSTIDQEGLAGFLHGLAQQYSSSFIFLKPHSNLGIRSPSYRRMFADLMDELSRRGLSLAIAKEDLVVLPYWRRWSIGLSKRVSGRERFDFACAVVDVSAAESMAAKLGVRSVVTVGRREAYPPEGYLSVKGISIVRLSGWSSMEACVAHAVEALADDGQIEYMRHFEEDGHKKLKLALQHIESDFCVRIKSVP